MKFFRTRRGKKDSRGGFSLVEATFSIGLLSCGVLTLAPLLALGMKSARVAQNDRATAQIAQTLVEEARQGTTLATMFYLNSGGTPCNSTQAVYLAQATSQPFPGSPSLTRMTLRLTPLGTPDRARIYAVVFQTAQ